MKYLPSLKNSIKLFDANLFESGFVLVQTSLSNKFNSNTLLRAFRELQYFTSVSDLSGENIQVLYHLQNLETISFPDNFITLGGVLRGEYNKTYKLDFSKIKFPSKLKTIRGYFCQSVTLAGSDFFIPEGVTYLRGSELLGGLGSAKCYRFVLPSTIETFGKDVFMRRQFTYGICKATTPPALNGNPFTYGNKFILYVPDESVNTYKVASYWSSWASYIKGFSDFATAYPDDAEELGLV